MTVTTSFTRTGRARHRAQTMRATGRRVLGWRREVTASGPSDRGDVPGWVLVTLMTAGLVVAIWAVAGPALTTMFTNALKSVTGP